jgi:signal transduction histidine kinase
MKWSTLQLGEVWGLGVRIFICFVVGFIVLVATQGGDYDTRFALRGAQDVGSDVVLVYLSRDDVGWMGGLSEHNVNNIIWSLKEIVETSDSIFWRPLIWEEALNKVINAGAKAAIVTLFFGNETVRGTVTPNQQRFFQNPPVFWAAKSDPDGYAVVPGLTTHDGRNTGILELRADPDGKVRHFLGVSSSLPQISSRVARYVEAHNAEAHSNENSKTRPASSHTGQLINFQGPQNTFRSYSFSELLKDRISPEAFKGRIVIFAVKDVTSHQVQTPVGLLTDGELLANVEYNFTHEKWVRQIPLWANTLYIFLILLISLWLIFEYPQSVAFVLLTFLGVAVMALSAALFDLQTIWTPASAAVATIVASYVVISSYRLSKSEKFRWESERELHYLSQVESLKNNFLSLISHDLKNPLAKIQGITDRLLSTPEKTNLDSLHEDLESIQRTSEELRQYIASILQLTRVEARNIKLTKEVCDINMIVEDVAHRVQPLAAQKKVEIRLNLEPIFSIEVDRNLIAEVLLNLVENAVKYSDEGSSIEINSQEIDNQVRVEVSDNGGGIAEEDLPKVFDKFYRGTGEKTLKVTGTGLGLYLVKYFIELHGGKVFINSQVGVGTKIGFFLPLEEPEENYAEFTRPHR